MRSRASAALLLAVGVLLSGCSLNATDERTDPPPSPTQTEFIQDLGDHAVLSDPVDITVSEDTTGAHMRAQNIGVSLEATDLADERLDPEKSTLDDRLKELGTPALRFGGNRLDRNLFWTSSDEPAPHEDAVVVGPEDLERLKRLTDATGATVTLGVPLGDFDPERGADMASHARQILGDALVGVAIGNEPNGYTIDGEPNHRLREDDWDTGEYLEQLEAYSDAIEEVAPGTPIVGPDVYDVEWMRAFAGADLPNTTALAQHWYALYDCESDEVPGRGPRAENLVSTTVRDSAETILGIGLSVAEEEDLPLWLEETGPTSCAGTNDTSRTQAKALWTADFTLAAAQLGVERVAMHSMLGPCAGGAPMSVVCSRDEGSAEIIGQNNHAAMRLAAMSVGGDFLEVDGATEGMRVHAVQRNDGDQIVVTLVNVLDAAEVDASPVSITVPQGYEATQASQVTADDLTSATTSDYQPALPLSAELPGAASPSGTVEPESDEHTIALDIDTSAATVLVFERETRLRSD